MKRVSVIDIAKECGISPSTVCRALNGKGDINQATRHAVLDACQRLGYVKDSAASRLRLRNSRLIVSITADQSNELFIEKLFFLKKNIRASEFRWQQFGFDNTDEIAEIFHHVISLRPAGILLCAVTIDDSLCNLAEKNGIPLVFYDAAATNHDSVILDRATGVYEATVHMLKKGRNRIMMLGASRDSVRGKAMVRAYHDHNLTVSDNYFITVPFGRDLFEYGYAMIKQQIGKLEFNGIMAINDAAAIGAIKAVTQVGIRIPEQLSVVGFDNIMVSKYTVPSLSTVVQPKEEMAKVATDFLFERIKGYSQTARIKKMKTHLVIRESS